ncbi:hypothetical protein [Peribacillus muralis]|uniref:hypothetical protein n=1 Tax=Peribacillus muralis TaxID=264697 RepID=UPI000A7DC9BF
MINSIKDFSVYVLSTIVSSGILLFIIRNWFKGNINSHFNKKLESHKHDLQKITEDIKYDYQRKIHDFSLYSNKKHEVYAELYKLLNEANIKIKIATARYREYPDFRQFEKVEKYLKEYQVSDDTIEHVRSKWIIGRNEGVKEFQRVVDMEKVIKADESRNKAYLYLINNELFLNDEVAVNAHDIADKLRLLVISENYKVLDGFEGTNRKDFYDEQKEHNITIDEKLKIVKVSMQKELAIGYYQEENNSITNIEE